MSIFNKIEQFPWTHENAQGEVVQTRPLEFDAISCVTRQLENIFNDNARIKS